MQGLHNFIPTNRKVDYINALLKVGFDTIDFGSFVSPKAIPQMADTKEVVIELDLRDTKSKLLAIVANERGAKDAVDFDEITYLGFPFSLSPTFQLRNTRATQTEALDRVARIQELCVSHKKQLVVYLSMAFGNPYGDVWNTEAIEPWVDQFNQLGIKILALADTVGVAEPSSIQTLFSELIPTYQHIEFGAHFHTRPDDWKEKISTAYEAGCQRFDSTIQGIGGCPMAEDELVGNMATENLLSYVVDHGEQLNLNTEALKRAQEMASELFM